MKSCPIDICHDSHFGFLRITAPTVQKSAKVKIFTTTILAPAGVAWKYEIIIPVQKQDTATTAEHIVTVLNLLKILMDVREGNITRLEISKAPIMRIPSTMVRAVKNAISILYALVFTPAAFAKVSSKVMANNLL